MKSKVVTREEALSRIHDGQTIMFGDWHGEFAADEIIDGMLEKGIKDIDAIAVSAGMADQGVGKLIKDHRVKSLITTHIGLNPIAKDQMFAGELAIEFSPQGTFAERIRCGGAGLGGCLTPTGLGTEVEEGKQKLTIDGKEYLLELPLRADVALIKATKADTAGNISFRMNSRATNSTMAMAADTVIVEVEEIVKVAEEFGLIIFSDEIYDRLVMDGLKHISIASIAPKNVFCVTFSGLSKSHMIAGFRVGWMVLSGNKKAAAGYIEGIKMLSNMRLCSNVPAQSIIQTALGGYQSVEEYLQPGGRIYEQREVIYKLLNDIPGVSAKKPKAAFYIFPKLDVEKFNIYDDEKFALDLLREKRILIVHGGGFNWGQPDHFRVVYLPRIADLEKATKKLGEFLDGYHQK